MGSVAQAVREFDEAVQVPWRPPLASAPALTVLPGGVAPERRRPHAARGARSAALPEASPARPTPSAVAGATVRRACPHCGSAAACPAPPLRLTRRARRLLAGVLTGAVVAAGGWLAASAEDDGALQLVSETTTVVEEGDTLWSIARSVAGDADVRVVVDEIQRLNDLQDADLEPGQVLHLP
jgi:nucleoid-associated protein YgaU